MVDDIFIIEHTVETNGKTFDMVVMFNKTVITESEVNKLIETGDVRYDKRVVLMYKEQYLNLMGKGDVVNE